MNPITMLFILGLGVLLFGKNLPDVARQVGLGFMEFKRGLGELKGTFDVGSLDAVSSSSKDRSDEYTEPSALGHESIGTKFEPPREA